MSQSCNIMGDGNERIQKCEMKLKKTALWAMMVE